MNLAHKVIALYTAHDKKIGLAESCTGGLIASALTDIDGASAVFHCALITYANQAKIDLAGVHEETLTRYGAVSAEVSIEMAQGVKNRHPVDVALSVTGIAGPNGGSNKKPIGRVHFSIVTSKQTHHFQKEFGNDTRESIRMQSVEFGLNLLYEAL